MNKQNTEKGVKTESLFLENSRKNNEKVNILIIYKQYYDRKFKNYKRDMKHLWILTGKRI